MLKEKETVSDEFCWHLSKTIYVFYQSSRVISLGETHRLVIVSDKQGYRSTISVELSVALNERAETMRLPLWFLRDFLSVT